MSDDARAGSAWKTRWVSSPGSRGGCAALVATVVALSVVSFGARDSGAIDLPDGFTDERLVGGLNQPVAMAFLPDGRLLVAERTSGWVRMIVNGALASTDPVGQISEMQSGFWEQGLLGIAIDPGWPVRPYVYVFFTAVDSTSRVVRFNATGDRDVPSSGNLALDPSSRHDVLIGLPDRMGNHNGGTLRFGTDGMLYVSLGEDNNPCAAQDTVSLRGVLLRLDVSELPDGTGGPPPRATLAAAGNPFASHPVPEARLVWALGLRNPFRFHVDPADGSIFVADVGGEALEEVDHVTAPGQNFGWPRFEGTQTFINCPRPPQGTLVPPIYEYANPPQAGALVAAVSAGIYRGGSCATCRFPEDYLGDYFVADFYAGFLRRLKRQGSTWSLAAPVPGQPSPSDWAQDLPYVADFQFGADGALWYCRFFDGTGYSGEIHRIHTAQAAGTPPRASLGVAFLAPRPTPSAGRVVFAFELARAARVALDLFDASGRHVARPLAPQNRGAGRHEVDWEGGRRASVAAGLYVARLQVDGAVITRRAVLLP